MNKTEEIYEYLRTYAYPYYNNAKRPYRYDREDSVFRGLLSSLTIDELNQIRELMEGDEHPYLLSLKIKGIIKFKERERMKFLPTVVLVDWYDDRKRKNRATAAAELIKRYPDEEFNVKCLILDSMLHGNKKEMEWAGRQLRDGWIERFHNKVQRRWEETHNEIIGYVILRHFPDSYILEHQEELADSTRYALVCARIGSDESFKIDSSRLSIPDHFYVAAKLNSPVKSENMEILLNRFLAAPYVNPDDFGLICWALGKLHMTYVLMRCGQKIVNNTK